MAVKTQGRRTRKKKSARTITSCTAIKRQPGASEHSCRKEEEDIDRCAPTAQEVHPTSAVSQHVQHKCYVMRHTERKSVCIGGCILPLPEVIDIKLGTLEWLENEMEAIAKMPFTFMAFVHSNDTTELTESDANVSLRVEAMDRAIQAYQAAYNTSSLTICDEIKRDVVRYAHEICRCRPPSHRTAIMDMLYQRMKNYAEMMAVHTIEAKLRDPCCTLLLHDDSQRHECLKALKTMKRTLLDWNKKLQRLLCE